jgi:deazaflavin-dependent oxidoreductase (nitroreductase family)
MYCSCTPSAPEPAGGRITPVAWSPDGDQAWLIVASSAGSRHNPDWYHNLAAHPDKAAIELPGQRTVPVTAEELSGHRREDAWRRVIAIQPRYARYKRKTNQELPSSASP